MAGLAARPCLHPGCPAIVRGASRCPDHQRVVDRQREQRRGTRTERGYGGSWPRISAAVIKRDGGICCYCGNTATTADHVVPKERGGTDDMDNLVASCVPCNSRKGAK